jgi:hypothetical protein
LDLLRVPPELEFEPSHMATVSKWLVLWCRFDEVSQPAEEAVYWVVRDVNAGETNNADTTFGFRVLASHRPEKQRVDGVVEPFLEAAKVAIGFRLGLPRPSFDEHQDVGTVSTPRN